jgi:hypothetical protein
LANYRFALPRQPKIQRVAINQMMQICCGFATSDGIYKTTDAGTTWQLTISGNFAQGRIRLKPNDANTVYAFPITDFMSTNAETTFLKHSYWLPTT